MLPRGTYVDKRFQYDSNAEVNLGEKGSTINPKHRKVLKKNIDDLKIENLIFKNNWSNLSNLTNRYHEKIT